MFSQTSYNKLAFIILEELFDACKNILEFSKTYSEDRLSIFPWSFSFL